MGRNSVLYLWEGESPVGWRRAGVCVKQPETDRVGDWTQLCAVRRSTSPAAKSVECSSHVSSGKISIYRSITVFTEDGA